MAKKRTRSIQLQTTILLFLIALISVTAATAAWFTIADRAKVRSMSMDITTGSSLRFDLDPHENFEDYIVTLSFGDIASRIRRDLGVDVRQDLLEPVTTEDYQLFVNEYGVEIPVESGQYLEFTLHFMTTKDMTVHLTSANSTDKSDGTLVSSDLKNLPPAMRISFTVDGKTLVYDPGAGDTRVKSGKNAIFGLPIAKEMQYNNNNALFDIKQYRDVPVVVHVWLEGTDELCTNELIQGDYSIQLRFVGTDIDGNVLE